EDLYINKTGETLPPSFFFSLASFGSFCYMNTPKNEIKKLIALGDGRTKQMYEFLAPVVGFEYKHYECNSFQALAKKIRREIDAGFPVVLGALDMYYLPYFPKLYHQEHIPFHYILVIGYDDDGVILLDGGRSDPLTLSYDELALASNCSYSGLSKPYTICLVRMNSEKTKEQIAREALVKKADLFLNPPVGFIGYKGYEKMIIEMPYWKEELGKEDYDKVLFNFVQFLGKVPTVPNALRGINQPDEDFYGGFDKMSIVLESLGKEYKDDFWIQAAKLLNERKETISEIKEIIVRYLINISDETDKLPEMFEQVKETLYQFFTKISEKLVKNF
ncbi:MAG: BtrH N-terminal domain-containing protein, partial [Acholeplasmataceae bacterium]|nr:BtrH N-terminal domain-containing protein [Acholeplasmataceae bacterium]